MLSMCAEWYTEGEDEDGVEIVPEAASLSVPGTRRQESDTGALHQILGLRSSSVLPCVYRWMCSRGQCDLL
jgi:hypothetical protein